MTGDSIYKRFKPANTPLIGGCENARHFVFAANKILIIEGDNPDIPTGVDLAGLIGHDAFKRYLGELEELPCYCLDAGEEPSVPPGLAFWDLRSLLGQLDEDIFLLAGRAFQLVNWHRTTKFCGRCGSLTDAPPGELVKKCPNCRSLFYPRISPAVIVAVSRGEEILLAHNKNFKNNMYSVLAGFIEPGETFEDCVKREIMEEVGIRVNNVKYFGSQPWPFPDSLMVGFTAEYESGEIVADGMEIEVAGWYRRDNLPVIPARTTIAGRLIQSFLQKIK